MIEYILLCVGMKLTPKCIEDYRLFSGSKGFRFSIADVLDATPRVKHMTLLDITEGRYLVAQASEALGRAQASRDEDAAVSEGRAAARLLNLGVDRFDAALDTEPMGLTAFRERLLASLFSTDELDPSRADQLAISIGRTFLDPKRPLSTQSELTVIVKPYFQYLFSLWEKRRSRGHQLVTSRNGLANDRLRTRALASSFLVCYGASSRQIIKDLEAILSVLLDPAQPSRFHELRVSSLFVLWGDAMGIGQINCTAELTAYVFIFCA
jgi:hypothetical protein